MTVELLSHSGSDDTRASPSRFSSSIEQSKVVIGNVVVTKETRWTDLEDRLGGIFMNHVSEVSIGLRTKKTSRLDMESPDAPNPFTLGIALSSVQYYSIGLRLFL